MFGKVYCFLCGFVEVMALGTVFTLHLGWLLSAVLLLTPVVLLILAGVAASGGGAAGAGVRIRST